MGIADGFVLIVVVNIWQKGIALALNRRSSLRQLSPLQTGAVVRIAGGDIAEELGDSEGVKTTEPDLEYIRNNLLVQNFQTYGVTINVVTSTTVATDVDMEAKDIVVVGLVVAKAASVGGGGETMTVVKITTVELEKTLDVERMFEDDCELNSVKTPSLAEVLDSAL